MPPEVPERDCEYILHEIARPYEAGVLFREAWGLSVVVRSVQGSRPADRSDPGGKWVAYWNIVLRRLTVDEETVAEVLDG